jgi:hypothetical protein
MLDLIRTRDVVDILGVTPSAVSLMVKRGVIRPVLKAPGTRGAFLFLRSDIEALAQRRRASIEGGKPEAAAS